MKGSIAVVLAVLLSLVTAYRAAGSVASSTVGSTALITRADWIVASRNLQDAYLVAAINGIEMGWAIGSADLHAADMKEALALSLSDRDINSIARAYVRPPAFSGSIGEYRSRVDAIYARRANRSVPLGAIVSCLMDKPRTRCRDLLNAR